MLMFLDVFWFLFRLNLRQLRRRIISGLGIGTPSTHRGPDTDELAFDEWWRVRADDE
jgi:hypothetical protein